MTDKVLDASSFIQGKLDLLNATQRWGGKERNQYPHGTIRLPEYTWLEYSKTINLPIRVCLVSDEPHVVDMPGFVAVGDWAESENLWAIEVNKAYNNEANYNGNFSTHLRNFSMDCRKLSNGIFFGGAQCSTVDNVAIYYAKDIALALGVASSRVTFNMVDIQNRRPNVEEPGGTAIYLSGSKSVNILGSNVHMADRGIEMNSCSNVSVIGLCAERVNTPFTLVNGTKSVNIMGVDIQFPGEIVVDLTGNRGNITIDGTIRKAPAQTFYKDFDGKLVPFVANATKSGGRDFRLRVNTAKSVELSVFN